MEQYLVPLVAYIIITAIAYVGLKKGWMTRPMYGRPASQISGEIQVTLGMAGQVDITVYDYGGTDPNKAVGIDFVRTTVGGGRTFDVTLSEREAREFAKYLNAAIEMRKPHNNSLQGRRP